MHKSALVPKGPAQSRVSPQDAQPHRLSTQQVTSYLSRCEKNEFNMWAKWENGDASRPKNV